MKKLFLSAVLICTTFAIIPTQTIMAQLQINGTGNFTTVTEFQTAITTALASGDVTVTGSLTNATESLTLPIPTNRQVIWQAEFSSSFQGASILVRGTPAAPFPAQNASAGTLEVAIGGRIENTAAMFGVAISMQSIGTTVIVSGGEVIGGNGIAARGISATSTGSGMRIIITGGVVSGGTNSIEMLSTVTSGSAVAFISGNPTITGAISTGDNGIAITYTGTGGTYDAGTSENLTVQPNTATAVWAVESDVSGVSFARGANIGFMAVEGVTVAGSVPQVWDIGYPTATNVTATLYNDTLTIAGVGAMANFNATTNTVPWFDYRANISTVIINIGITSIGTHTFHQHSNLETIAIPITVSSIGAFAFQASGLTSVAIPINVATIAEGLFWDAANLASVTIPNNVTAIGNNAFNGAGLTSIVIPNNVTTIGNWAFGNCANLTSVSIGNSVTSIGTSAFANTGLAWVTIPNNVTSIGASAFAGLNLESLTIANGTNNLALGNTATGWSPDTLHLGRNVTHTMAVSPFGTNIKCLTIGDSVTSIPNNAFWGNTNLDTVTIPNSITSIGSNAFRGTGLRSVVIPNGVTSIGISAFQDCSNLTTVTLPNSLTTIGNSAFQNSGLTSITLPTNLTSIGNSAFENSVNLTGNLILPAGLTTIGNSAFANTGFVGELIFPASLTNIGTSAFSNNTGLTSLFIPNNAITIGDLAFFNNPSVISVISPRPVPPIIHANTFLNIHPNACLYVPEASVEAYELAIGWNLISCVEPLATFTVTFNSQGGTEIEAQTVSYGNRPTEPTTPIRAGSIFEGWSIDAEGTILWNFATDIVTSNLTLFAKWDVVFEGGGTSENPLKIATAEQLATLAEWVNTNRSLYRERHYILVANIDLSDFGVDFNAGRGWIPIGTWTNPFRGHFDGDGFTIRNLFIHNDGVDNLGLFGTIDNGSVRNLAVVDADITGRHTTGIVVGRLVNQGQVHACYTTGTVRSTQHTAGGIAGNNGGRIENSYSTATVITTYNLSGGIAGRSDAGSLISNSYATGEIRSQSRVGGIAGDLSNWSPPDNGRIINSVALNVRIISDGDGYDRIAARIAALATTSHYSGSAAGNRGLDVIEGGPFDHWSVYNGTDMTIQQAGTASFWTAASNWHGETGWCTNVWIIEDGRFPRLRVMKEEQPTSLVDNIVELPLVASLQVFPNPFTSEIHIADAEGFMLQVLTQTGVVVHTQRLTNSVETVNLQHLSAGVYILHLQKDGEIKATRIVKQ